MATISTQDRLVLYQTAMEMCKQWVTENYRFLKSQQLIELNKSSLHNLLTFNLGALSDLAQSSANLETTMNRFASLNTVNDVDKSVMRIAEVATRITYCVGETYVGELKKNFKMEMGNYYRWSSKHCDRMLKTYPWLFLHPIMTHAWEQALGGK